MRPITANYHTHTPRCKHAWGTEEEYIEAAIANGLQVLGFSDHVPVPYPDGYVSGIRMDPPEITDYTETLGRLREQYRGQIRLLIGYEVEYMPRFFHETMELIHTCPVDYLIQGQHFVPDEVDGFYSGKPTGSEKDLAAYVDLTIEGMETGLFSCLAHPDLINYVGDPVIYEKHMARLVEAAKRLSLPLEINLLGFLTHRNYPDERFLSLASAMGADFVIGCDAHVPSQILQPEEVPGFAALLEKYAIQPVERLGQII